MFMKQLLIAITLFSTTPAFACPSIDETIAKEKVGEATMLDVESAILCKVSTCSLKVAILTDIVVGTSERYNAGEVTKDDVTNAAQNLAKAKLDCSK